MKWWNSATDRLDCDENLLEAKYVINNSDYCYILFLEMQD